MESNLQLNKYLRMELKKHEFKKRKKEANSGKSPNFG
jgi:hypothetical protein